MTVKQLKEYLANIPDDYTVLMGSKRDFKSVNFLCEYLLSSAVIMQEYGERGEDKGFDMTKEERRESFNKIVMRAADWYLWKEV